MMHQKIMKTFIRLIVLLTSSFILLGIAAFNMEKLTGVLFWLVSTLIIFYLLFGKSISTRIKENNALYQKQQLELENEKIAQPYEPQASKKITSETGFIPWTEEELLWQGKRKLFLRYMDRNGSITERNVEIVGVWPNQYGEVMFRAYCHLRGEWRTFYAERVLHITNARKKQFSNFFEYSKEDLGI